MERPTNKGWEWMETGAWNPMHRDEWTALIILKYVNASRLSASRVRRRTFLGAGRWERSLAHEHHSVTAENILDYSFTCDKICRDRSSTTRAEGSIEVFRVHPLRQCFVNGNTRLLSRRTSLLLSNNCAFLDLVFRSCRAARFLPL